MDERHPDCSMTSDDLKLIMKKLGWNNGNLKYELGISRRTARGWTNGYYAIPSTVSRLMRLIEVSYLEEHKETKAPL